MPLQTNIHLIGNAHLDPVWLWQWQEGYAEIKATFRSALDRMNEFPEFVFTCACAAYYKWVEENAPEMFAEIRQRAAEGRWVIVGGWWIQPDCNLPSGESFARHSLYSQRYFQEKFGVMSRVGYNVDSFGHHGMIPQILKQSGMDSYVFMRPMKHEKHLEDSLFWWESEDGSKVMAFRLADGYHSNDRTELPERIRQHKEKAEEEQHDHMTFYGVGNHGGGPTISALKSIQQLIQQNDKNDILLSSPNAYFDHMAKLNPAIPVIKDEMQMHAVGCYSTHSESKNAEKFSTIANIKLQLPYPSESLKQAWENVMFNQFHDIIGGCSIKEAFDDAKESYGEALSIGAKALNAALQKLSWSINTMKPEIKSLSKEKDWHLWEQGDSGTPLVVFNPLSWDITVPIQMTKQVSSVSDDQEQFIPIQTVRASRTNLEDNWDTLFEARIPAFGYRVYWAYLDKNMEPATAARPLHVEDNVLENDWIRVEFDPLTGFIQQLLDKRTNVNLFTPGSQGAVPIVIDESHSDTWGHGLDEYRNEIGRFSDATFKILEKGPLRAAIRISSRYQNSFLRQDFILQHDSPDLKVKVFLDWREQHKMLKLSFDLAMEQPKAVWEIPYGFIERPVNGKEVPGQQWVDMSGLVPGSDDQACGLAIVNDAKYGYDALESDVRITAVRSPLYADHYGVRDDLAEFMDQGIQEFSYSLIPHSGSWQDNRIVQKAYELNVPPLQIWETYHEGPLAQHGTGIRISCKQIVAAAFKPAEDGDGFILRCYECTGRKTDANIELPMLERSWSSSFGKCEIKTFHIPSRPDLPVKEVNFIEI